MKLNALNTKKAMELDEALAAGKKINRKQKRFMAAHLPKWTKANMADIMDGIGPHPGCDEFC